MEQIDKYFDNPENQTIIGAVMVAVWVVVFILFLISGIREKLRK